MSDSLITKLVRCRRVFYEFGNKPGKILAMRFGPLEQRPIITCIKKDDTLVKTSLDIAGTFQAYYVGLYSLPLQSSLVSQETKQGLMQQYLAFSGMPNLAEDI